jgi:hypothetical protein
MSWNSCAKRTASSWPSAEEHFLISVKGVDAAQGEFNKLFGEVQRVCAASSGLVVRPERQGLIVSMDAAGLSR